MITKITTFGHSTVKVIEKFRQVPEEFSYIKTVVLPEKSPLKQAGIDSFKLVELADKDRYIEVLNKAGNPIAGTYMSWSKELKELKAMLVNIRKFGLHI
jgi:hypothetical protein